MRHCFPSIWHRGIRLAPMFRENRRTGSPDSLFCPAFSSTHVSILRPPLGRRGCLFACFFINAAGEGVHAKE
jgi:hypothetical protein